MTGETGRAADAHLPPSTGRLLLAAALLFTVLISGSDSGRLLTVFRTAGALIGAILIVTYIRNAPRRHDRVDQLALAGLLLFVLACAASSLPRLSFEPAVTAFAYAAAFYVARDAVRDPAGRALAITVLGFLGTVVAAILLILWGLVWLQWVSVPGAGLPPLNLVLPSTQYYPIRGAMLVGLLLPATVMLARRSIVWPLGVVGVAASLAVIVMSGSRTLWLAGAVALTVVLLLNASRVRRVSKRAVSLGAVLVVLIVVALLPQLLDRITAGSSVDLRLAIWADALGMWLASPWDGHGPGTFASALTLSGFYNSLPTYIGHAHSLPVQLLVESGVIGVVVISLLVGAIAVGAVRQLSGASAALAAIALFAVLSLTADPTLDAFLVIPLITWSALLCPRVRSVTPTFANRRIQIAGLGAAAVAAIATGATLAAAWSHDQAAASSRSGDAVGVIRHLRSATALDPSMALYHRELGVWLLVAREVPEGRTELERAVRLGPADHAAMRALAVARADDGDRGGALRAAAEALGRADLHPENGLTLAYVGEAVGDRYVSQRGMVRAVRIAPWLLASAEWDSVFPQTSKGEILDAARESWIGSTGASFRNERARAWLGALAGETPVHDVGPAAQAEAAMLRCRADLVEEALDHLSPSAATELSALQAKLMVDRAFGDELTPGIAKLMTLRDANLARLSFGGVSGQSPFMDYAADVQAYGSAPIPPPVSTVFPTPASGLSAWLQDPVAAADAGAPDSALARCR